MVTRTRAEKIPPTNQSEISADTCCQQRQKAARNSRRQQYCADQRCTVYSRRAPLCNALRHYFVCTHSFIAPKKSLQTQPMKVDAPAPTIVGSLQGAFQNANSSLQCSQDGQTAQQLARAPTHVKHDECYTKCAHRGNIADISSL